MPIIPEDLAPGSANPKACTASKKALLCKELQAAGFRLVAEGQFLRDPADPRDKSVFKPVQPND